MKFLIVLALLTLIVVFVTAPVRREWRRASQRRAAADGASPDPATAEDVDSLDSELERELDELDAAREAKYREIRDAEMDHRTGKLSDADFAAVDASLRAEAIEILKALDRVRERG
jgi:hypothetical protein